MVIIGPRPVIFLHSTKGNTSKWKTIQSLSNWTYAFILLSCGTVAIMVRKYQKTGQGP